MFVLANRVKERTNVSHFTVFNIIRIFAQILMRKSKFPTHLHCVEKCKLLVRKNCQIRPPANLPLPLDPDDSLVLDPLVLVVIMVMVMVMVMTMVMVMVTMMTTITTGNKLALIVIMSSLGRRQSDHSCQATFMMICL